MTLATTLLASALVVPNMPPPEYDDCEVDGKLKVEWEPKPNFR